jgi:hypothetical membrane protein
MMTTGIPYERIATEAVGSRSIVRRGLLACGILSSLLYIVTDLSAGIRYEGYSFFSQAVSELAAVGAPTRPVVVPLFLVYGVLAFAFGVGVLREGVSGQNRPMRIAGSLLIVYATAGFTGFTLFPMQRRGIGSLETDLYHIVVTGVVLFVLLLAMVFGAFALARWFRVYSFATVFTVIAFGALTIPYGARLAGGQSTPGFGIVERIDIYSFLTWVAVLAAALLRNQHRGAK